MKRSIRVVLVAILAVCGIVLYREHLGMCFWLLFAGLAGAITVVTLGAGKLYLMWAAKRVPQKRPNTGLFILLAVASNLLVSWMRSLHLSHRTFAIISSLLGVVMFSLVGVMFARIMHWQHAIKANCAES